MRIRVEIDRIQIRNWRERKLDPDSDLTHKTMEPDLSFKHIGPGSAAINGSGFLAFQNLDSDPIKMLDPDPTKYKIRISGLPCLVKIRLIVMRFRSGVFNFHPDIYLSVFGVLSLLRIWILTGSGSKSGSGYVYKKTLPRFGSDSA